MSNLNLTIVIPVHSVADPNFKLYLDGALKSIQVNEVKPEKVLIVRCPCGEVREEIASMDLSIYGLNVEVLENNTGKSFGNQMNFAAKNVATKYFSFLEFDDEYSNRWFRNVQTYTEAYPEVNMFLPIISDVDAEGKFQGYTNEAVWAKDFSERMGFIDTEVLIQSPNFNLSGMVVNTDAFLAVGGFKPSIKLYFNYELLLRFANSGNQIMVIPRIGYKHVNMRPGGLFWSYKNSTDEHVKLDAKEANFWYDVAMKEYFFNEDRNITYVKPTN